MDDVVIARELGTIRQSLADLKEDVGEIKTQTQRTNGRVTQLELDKANRVGAAGQRASTRVILTLLAGFLVTLLASAGAVVLAKVLEGA